MHACRRCSGVHDALAARCSNAPPELLHAPLQPVANAPVGSILPTPLLSPTEKGFSTVYCFGATPCRIATTCGIGVCEVGYLLTSHRRIVILDSGDRSVHRKYSFSEDPLSIHYVNSTKEGVHPKEAVNEKPPLQRWLFVNLEERGSCSLLPLL